MRFEITGHLSDPTAAWEAVADTDQLNREGGNGRVKALDVAVDDNDFPLTHGVFAGPLGTRLVFADDDNRWIRGRMFRQGRSYEGGPMLRSTYEVWLDPAPGGVIPRVTLEIEPRSVVFAPIVAAAQSRIRRGWQGVLDRIPKPGEHRRPVLRELVGAADEAFQRWSREVDPTLAQVFREHLRTARVLELQQLRPLELADRWAMDRGKLVDAMLDGAQRGVFELYWSVRCPRCQAQTASSVHLGNLADHSSCPSCRIGFGADLSSNVEVLFAPHPSVVDRVQESFCTLFPLANPAVEASVILAPGQDWREQVALHEGTWRLGAGGRHGDLAIRTDAAGARELSWQPGLTGEALATPGTVDVAVGNSTNGRLRVQLASMDASHTLLPASYLTSHATFRRSMSDQVLAPDTRVSTRSVVLLFTDLTGSTAMYRELGDARAYALVRDHFGVLRAAIEAERGTIVKTIGDAVMAAFYEPGQAVQAGIRMIRDHDLWVATQGLTRSPRLRVGIHVGPALVVHTDEAGLDYFGQTVNLAARAQGIANGGELVITADCLEWHGVRAALSEHALTTEPVEARLKGIDQPVRLHKAAVGILDIS